MQVDSRFTTNSYCSIASGPDMRHMLGAQPFLSRLLDCRLTAYLVSWFFFFFFL